MHDPNVIGAFQAPEQVEIDEQQFLEDAKFAKIVTAVGGQGILIGGMVFSVMGPVPNSVELIAKALRRDQSELGWVKKGCL